MLIKELEKIADKQAKKIFYTFRRRLYKKLKTKPLTCLECNKDFNIHLHHVDYNKLKRVIPLCAKHHRRWHMANKAIPMSDKTKQKLIYSYILDNEKFIDYLMQLPH